MAGYSVYLHDIPKVGDDGKPLPIKPNQSQDFEDLEAAKNYAGEHKDQFERISVMHDTDDGTKMVERYIDGEHIVPDA
ncbi:MAG: hypothetical protein AAF560_13935 [Acidobacteriota bacterium]